MQIFYQMRLFQKVATGIFIIFMGLMIMVTIYAHSRTSGSTRQDMSEAPLVRAKVMQSIVAEREIEKK